MIDFKDVKKIETSNGREAIGVIYKNRWIWMRPIGKIDRLWMRIYSNSSKYTCFYNMKFKDTEGVYNDCGLKAYVNRDNLSGYAVYDKFNGGKLYWYTSSRPWNNPPYWGLHYSLRSDSGTSKGWLSSTYATTANYHYFQFVMDDNLLQFFRGVKLTTPLYQSGWKPEIIEFWVGGENSHFMGNERYLDVNEYPSYRRFNLVPQAQETIEYDWTEFLPSS